MAKQCALWIHRIGNEFLHLVERTRIILDFIVEIVLGPLQIILLFASTFPICLNNSNIFAVAVWSSRLCKSES